VTLAQLRRLDARQAKLAFLNGGLQDLDRFYEEVTDRDLGDLEWEQQHEGRYWADFDHWEREFRATLRRDFPPIGSSMLATPWRSLRYEPTSRSTSKGSGRDSSPSATGLEARLWTYRGLGTSCTGENPSVHAP